MKTEGEKTNPSTVDDSDPMSLGRALRRASCNSQESVLVQTKTRELEAKTVCN